MDNTDGKSILELVHPENLTLIITQSPFVQSQDKGWSINNARYRDYDLFVCYGGSAVFTIDGAAHELAAGRALLAPPGRLINARKTSRENFDAIAQHFELRIFGSLDFFSLFTWRASVSLSNWLSVSPALARYAELAAARSQRLVRHGLFFSIIGEFISDAFITERANAGERHRFVFEMAAAIERNLSDEASVEKALAASPYSAEYTARMFRRYTGLPPRKYFTLCRLRAGKDSLLAGKTVKEASARAGFRDELYFSRLFSKYEGMSPREFQHSMGVRRRARQP